MRKLLAVFLSVSCLLLICGCKSNKKDNTSSPAEAENKIEQILINGKIQGTDYALGTSVEQIKTDTKYGEIDAQEGTHNSGNELFIVAEEKATRLVYNSCYYYYENGKEDKGISSIVSFVSIDGLECGQSGPDEVRVAFSSVQFEQRNITADDVYFVSAPLENCFALSYSKDSRRIDFVFSDGVLIAINLIDTENWSLS